MKPPFFAVAVGLILFSCSNNQTEPAADTGLESRVDSLVQPFLDSAQVAGMAIAVFRDNQPLLLKSYGYADLEFDVKMPVDAIFEIGSVTKQFTGAAILQLAEQGKLALDDDLTQYLDYDTQGKKVTIRQLLSHTSGIKGYTELPFFEDLSIKKHDRDTLLRLVEKEGFDFEPGEALIYNNTAFFMLGLIIEKITGGTYEDYVKKNLFEKAGMTHSCYCSESKVIKNMAHGYDTRKDGLEHATYLDQTWPYAAGSLCSTPEDLVKWNDALHHGKILTDPLYQEFITPVTLNDGTATHYAKGITVTTRGGRRLLEHGGGINGFLSQNSFYPDDNVSIVVLINSTGPVAPRAVADQIADFVFGKPADQFMPFEGDLSAFAGTYKGRGRGRDITVDILEKGAAIAVKGRDDQSTELHYLKDNTWSDGRTLYHFSGDGQSFDELRMDQTYGYLILKRSQADR